MTKRRVWVLCPESEEEYRLWFEGVEGAIVSCGSGNIIERKLPNVRKYYMKGITTYRILYFLFLILSVVEIFGLVFWFVVGTQPCDSSNRTLACEEVYNNTPDDLNCLADPMSGWFTPPDWYLLLAGVDDVACFHNPPLAQWVAFFALIVAELVSIVLGALYYLDSDMQPHSKFVVATLPFFFDDEDRQYKNKYSCSTMGCQKVAKMCCASCKIAGVPEERISYCSRECFENAMHVQSDLHRRQVNGTLSDTRATKKDLRCMNCDSKLGETGVCRKCNTNNNNGESNMSILHTYSDDVRDNAVGFVQTPQYFRDCVQLQIGDPLGHRNAAFYDAIQTGQDGYDCASFAGTNALVRREALDSIGGIQYGTLTEDCYTGERLVSMGWKALYFRKDFEGEAHERVRLAEGAIPDSVAGAMAQRKRWAKGNFQTLLMKKNKNVADPEWKRPHVDIPKYRKPNNFMRRVFYLNSTLYPIDSISVILLYYVTLYFLYTGYAPIFVNGLRVLVALVPKLIVQGLLSALSTRGVENNDVVRSQETRFVYAFTNFTAMLGAIVWKFTGRKSKWLNKRDARRGSLAELPNVLVFSGAVFGIIWAMVRFMVTYYNRVFSHGDSMLCAAVLMGFYIAYNLGPSVRMSIQEYFGWSYQSLMDQGNFMGSISIAVGLMFIALWVQVEKPVSG
ncbi:unnamed protein product [Peronospora belbahrii]|uniref:Glycosyltransferase 2-like domain-containing protein n=1 Tax=Peronospora belbahrii TaxID=622444 RepID=A0ABN8CMS7_9STRA|nr:unnamed protein product [Peronospora belbahrii]